MSDRTHVSLHYVSVAMTNCDCVSSELIIALNIRKFIERDPNAKKWNLIMDCLNTHESETLVCLVAEKEGLDIDNGVKGKSGILKS